MSTRWTAQDVTRVTLKRQIAAMPRAKFGNKKVPYDGFVFDSRKECQRYIELRMLEKAGKVQLLAVHEEYTLRVNEIVIGHYTPDFRWKCLDTGEEVVEDVKGGKATKTEAYVIRKKLMLAIYGINIRES